VLMISGWVAASALLFAAPFQPVFRLVFSRGDERSVDGIDGWGRSPDPISWADGPRFGIALWACAIGLAMLAAWCAAALRRADQGVSLSRVAAAVGVPCLLGGVCGSLVLYVQSYAEQFRALRPQGGGHFRIEWEWCMWLSMTALVLAVAATLMFFRSLRSTSPDLEPPSGHGPVDQ
jgi:hypothetical protein